jgi:hypothetical protein
MLTVELHNSLWRKGDVMRGKFDCPSSSNQSCSSLEQHIQFDGNAAHGPDSAEILLQVFPFLEMLYCRRRTLVFNLSENWNSMRQNKTRQNDLELKRILHLSDSFFVS